MNDIEIQNLLKYFKNDYNFSNEVTFEEFKDFIVNKIQDFDSYNLLINDSAGEEIYKAFNYLSDINLLKNNKDTFFGWQEKINSHMETKTFCEDNNSNIFYTDIKNAQLCSFDKIYINSMNRKNFPKKNINNFSKNNIIYSDFSMDANIEEIENIEGVELKVNEKVTPLRKSLNMESLGNIYDYVELVKNMERIIIF